MILPKIKIQYVTMFGLPMKKTITLFALFIVSFSYGQNSYPIIPAPVSLKQMEGSFVINRSTYIAAHDIVSYKDGTAFRDFLLSYYNYPLKTTTKILTAKNYISVKYDSTLQLPDEGYILKVYADSITITGKNNGGVFHGLISLLQLFTQNQDNFSIPCCEITDYPRFGYRGMHLDCARHFFDIAFIKKYIDYLALYKYNTFHWHLTDDQGWRIEIKQYPRLTEVGAWRNGSMVGHYRNQQFDTIKYGGYYTQADIKEIINYAEARHITIIPEIEMPGHCVAALASYPQYGCIDDTTIEVAKAWGGFANIFCPKDETFTFLENILDEVMALFPSAYIHIGGDEVEKTEWKESAFCQQLIKDKKLKDENGLQSYFIQRIENYVNSKGKKIIGWDEILDGGIAANVTIMSWRGEEGGIAAAQQNHFAIMTPGSYCYFDHYQGSPLNEPLAIGGFTPIEKVYAYEPIPAQLNTEQAKYILGAQANIWTEYITKPQQVEYMAIPRMLALSEVLWTPKENKNYDDFVKRLLVHFTLLDKVKCNYAKSLFQISFKLTPQFQFNGIFIYPQGNPLLGDYFISTDKLKDGPNIDAQYLTHSDTSSYYYASHPEILSYIKISFNKATGKKITLTTPPSTKYAADGAFTLVDGIVATTKPNWTKNEWLGFSGNDCEALIDLGKTDTISKITVGYLDDKLSWIWTPKSVILELSVDGINYSTPLQFTLDETDVKTKRNYTISVNKVSARFVKLKIENYGIIPPGNAGAGKAAWLFVDEISVQ